jgi:hypothetical protein
MSLLFYESIDAPGTGISPAILNDPYQKVASKVERLTDENVDIGALIRNVKMATPRGHYYLSWVDYQSGVATNGWAAFDAIRFVAPEAGTIGYGSLATTGGYLNTGVRMLTYLNGALIGTQVVGPYAVIGVADISYLNINQPFNAGDTILVRLERLVPAILAGSNSVCCWLEIRSTLV